MKHYRVAIVCVLVALSLVSSPRGYAGTPRQSLEAGAGHTSASVHSAHLIQGQFASASEQLAMQDVLAKTFGNPIRIASPADDILEGHGDGAASDGMGISVAISGDTALVGSAADDTSAGINAGSAYVFVRNGATWALQAKLMASGAAANDGFGFAITLLGDTALMSAPGDGVAGAVYVFARSGTNWSQQAKLTASDGEAGDSFGNSVALAGDSALIGAITDQSSAGWGVGSAYVFVRNGANWSEEAKLTANDGKEGDLFATSVALADDTALIGARQADTVAGGNAGSAYLFVRNGSGWSQHTKLIASNGIAGDGFGYAVAIAGDTALVGAPYHAASANEDGIVYVFVRDDSDWTEQAQLVAGDSAAFDNFGMFVALQADTALVGAPGNNGPPATNGAAYVFARTGTSWDQQAKLVASNGAAEDGLGSAVALSDGTALLGAPRDDNAAGTDAGSAQVFTRSGTNWSAQAQLDAGYSAASEEFGVAIAVSGNTALVGVRAGRTGPNGLATGSAYVFVHSGTSWDLQAQLTASDAANSDSFGQSVALDGDTALVGSYLDNTAAGVYAGSAYVFVRNGSSWSEQAKLTASNATGKDWFGTSVALDADTALIGAVLSDTSGATDVGVAYVFVRNGSQWSEQATLIASAGAQYDRFGGSVAIAGDSALVGASGTDTLGGANAGAAYVFDRSGTSWIERAQLTASDGAAGDGFGYALALVADTALVGAPGDDTPAGVGAGSAYVFNRSGTNWSEQAQLTASDAAQGDAFGRSVALSGEAAMVGAYKANAGSGVSDVGAAYAFARSGALWNEESKLTPSDGKAGDQFGTSVTLSEEWAAAGAPGVDGASSGDLNVGSLHLFERGHTSADLQIEKDNDRDKLVDGESTLYSIVVANAGPSTVSDVAVLDALPTTLINGSWVCMQALSTAMCPDPAAGDGDLDVLVDLGVDQYLRFDVIAEVSSEGSAFVTNTAKVVAPAGIIAVNPTNDSATDQDPILLPEIFKDSFETVGE